MDVAPRPGNTKQGKAVAVYNKQFIFALQEKMITLANILSSPIRVFQ